jgi:molybdenum cofactor cytidylyltransferase
MSGIEAGRDAEAGIRIEAIVLAAGLSTRFGGQKLLADVGGEPLIRRTVSGILESRVAGVTVVVGADAEAVRDALAGLDVAFTLNPDHAAGMGTSIAAGVRTLAGTVDAAVIALGDQPVAHALIDALIEAFVSEASPIAPLRVRDIVIPEFGGVRAPPVLFGRSWFGALEVLTGDSGARGIVEANPALVSVLAMEGRAPPDIDTRADHAAFTGDPPGGYANDD